MSLFSFFLLLNFIFGCTNEPFYPLKSRIHSALRVITDKGEGVKHVEREEINENKNDVHQKITIDPAGVTTLDQVPRIFQRRVSAFGVRNQQDSTFRNKRFFILKSIILFLSIFTTTRGGLACREGQ